jgi:hypothetical protein
VLFAILEFGAVPARAVNPNRTLIGAIRWDGNTGDTPTTTVSPDGKYVGQQVERALGPNKYHYRVPFFGVETGTDSVQARELTQAVMDQDIAYAKSAGIDYWAFNFYPDGSGMDIGRNLYDSSTHKADVKYCFIASSWMPVTYFGTLVGKFAEPNYQKVLGNRPLLYIFGTYGFTAADITNLRNLTVAAGLGTPYIVMIGQASNASGTLSDETTLGADAITAYVTGVGTGQPYSALAASEPYYWNQYKATGTNVVPWLTTGWDPRPRIDNPVSWTTYASTNWGQDGAPWEIASHLQDGLNWVDSNPTVANANTVLMYAWNEFDEGFGALSPTLYTGTDRLDALKLISKPSVPGLDLLSNPGFESGITPWVAQSSSIAASSAYVHSGSKAVLINNRTAAWGAATQDVKGALLANGQGFYTASIWAAFASGSDTVQIVINTVDSSGSHWFTTRPITLSATYKQLAGVMNVSWTGTLTSAIIYTQTASSLADMYEDDFSLSMDNELSNPGFENGTTSWAALDSSITADSTDVHSGLGAVLISNRTAVWGAAGQDVTNILQAYGPGNYTTSAWLSFATATDNVQIVIRTVDDAGSHCYTTSPVSITTRYKNISDSINVIWTGTLYNATIYTRTTTSLDDMYEDDFRLSKQP